MRSDPVMIGCCGANLASLRFAFERLGKEIEVSDEPDRLRRATHVVLPGVGAAKDAMERLERFGLTEVIRQLTVPVLGICLGMQLLFRRSDEEDAACLGVIAADIERLPETSNLPIPEMGWNQIGFDVTSALTRGIESGAYAYFVHSYAAPLGHYTRAVTEYGSPFSSVVEQDNFYGTQFHPERSSRMGARILENFLEL
jgi:imidazole glycerol-phosphate synthase subunit HisH